MDFLTSRAAGGPSEKHDFALGNDLRSTPGRESAVDFEKQFA
jgi:hypothetical protein